MHEASLIRNLVKQIEAVALQNDANSVLRVRVRLGALSHCTPEHFLDHYRAETRGSIAEHAKLEFEVGTDELDDPHAQDIILQSIDVE